MSALQCFHHKDRTGAAVPKPAERREVPKVNGAKAALPTLFRADKELFLYETLGSPFFCPWKHGI